LNLPFSLPNDILSQQHQTLPLVTGLWRIIWHFML
jgi:hypothetical protein